jgi:pimeloyl-ACP methyl ester carboxylesterase
MSRVILMHGGYDEPDYRSHALPSASNRQWLPWVQNRLLAAGYDAQTPEVFRSYAFDYDGWRREFERHVDDEMSLVGHSTGAGFFLRWLSENPSVHIDKLVLVAPYIDPFGAHIVDGFFDFELGDDIETRVNEFHIFHSADDMPEIVASVDRLLSAYQMAAEHRYEYMGHFTTESMGTDSFVDLVAVFVTHSGVDVQIGK